MFQACWLVSAFGLLLLALDCMAATGFPFSYGERKAIIIVTLTVVGLWISALIFTGLLVYFELSYSGIIQYVICALMFAILLAVVAGCIYTFVLTERIRSKHMRTLVDKSGRRTVIINNN